MFSQRVMGGGGGARANGPHLEFRAGRMTLDSNRVTADPRRGRVTLATSPEGLLTLTWRDRSSGNVGDESYLFPGSATFERVAKVSDGRVLLLRFADSSAKKFFWMQEPDASHDEDLITRCAHGAEPTAFFFFFFFFILSMARFFFFFSFFFFRFIFIFFPFHIFNALLTL
jgi:hypothetical protein